MKITVRTAHFLACCAKAKATVLTNDKVASRELVSLYKKCKKVKIISIWIFLF